jgi:hypothetical protein
MLSMAWLEVTSALPNVARRLFSHACATDWRRVSDHSTPRIHFTTVTPSCPDCSHTRPHAPPVTFLQAQAHGEAEPALRHYISRPVNP